MKFDRQFRPAKETSWVVYYGGKTIPRWQILNWMNVTRSKMKISNIQDGGRPPF